MSGRAYPRTGAQYAGGGWRGLVFYGAGRPAKIITPAPGKVYLTERDARLAAEVALAEEARP